MNHNRQQAEQVLVCAGEESEEIVNQKRRDELLCTMQKQKSQYHLIWTVSLKNPNFGYLEMKTLKKEKMLSVKANTQQQYIRSLTLL